MNTHSPIEVVLGSKRFKSNPDTNLNLIPLIDSKQQELEEYDRTIDVNLNQVFDDERQACTIFRPTFSVDIVFFNAYTGTTNINGTNYGPFLNDLAYTDAENSIVSGTHPGIWYGYPQYKEFNFYRRDNTTTHLDFVNSSAFTYNWGYYLSYAYENDSTRTLQHFFDPNNSISWTCSDGIPFIISRQEINGRTYVQFTCPMNHNLLAGDYVELEFPGGWTGVNDNKIFQVDTLGDVNYGTESIIFNIYDIGYETPLFANSNIGTFKKIVDITNPQDTKSIYYVRKHKVLTNIDDALPLKAGFSQNGFFSKKRFQTSALTPNFISSVVETDGSQNFNITFSKDINLDDELDNLNRPVNEIFLTIVNKGYFGWFNRPRTPLGSDTSALKEGYKFNIARTSGQWWDDGNLLNSSKIPTGNYQKTFNGNNYVFYYNQDLKEGDTIYGDFCEFNSYLQEETVISEYYHKFEFNPSVFNINENPTTNSPGYYYKPHNKMSIRVFSDYVEEANSENVIGIPNYAFYSENLGLFRWRDIYAYGYIDSSGNGVNYPYLNKSHYPFENINFKIYPETNINEYVLDIQLPSLDECQ